MHRSWHDRALLGMFGNVDHKQNMFNALSVLLEPVLSTKNYILLFPLRKPNQVLLDIGRYLAFQDSHLGKHFVIMVSRIIHSTHTEAKCPISK